MQMRRMVVFMALAVAAACGSGSGRTLPDPGPDAGLDRTKLLTAASASDVAVLCDWTAGRVGGYSMRHVCGGLTLTTPANQAMCVSGFGTIDPSCTATLGDFEDCVNAGINGPCTAGSIPAACLFLLFCGMPML